MFTFYCMKLYQRHHLLSKSFSPPQRRHGVCVTISIYTLVLPIYVLFLCDFTCVVWLMGQLWPFCVNKMTTTTLRILISGCLSLNRRGVDYFGRVNQTINEIPCQRWSSQTPHSHTYTDPNGFWDNTVEEAESFCRNPTTPGQVNDWPWCFTSDPATQWDFCYTKDYCGKFSRSS